MSSSSNFLHRMDDTLKDILGRHWTTLVRHINPTSPLINVLVEDKVLPSAMIDDIKKASNRREKNEILLKSIKLRGNTSYRKFREAMLKCGQVFIADLLYEDEMNRIAYIEESDISTLPALKLSLNPLEVKQLVLTLDARVRAKILKNEWRKDSQRRLELLKSRDEEYKTEKNHQISVAEYEQKIKQLTAELNVKNDIIRSLSLDVNVLSQEVINFTQKHQLKSSSRPLSSESDRQESSTSSKQLSNRLGGLVGESTEIDEEVARMETIESKTFQVQQLVRDLEGKITLMQKDKDEALQMLLPGKKNGGLTTVQGVQRFQMQEQKYRYSLLKDIDRLSRKLRGMTVPNPASGLFALRQSAVTGKPSPAIVDFRFLSNHVFLLEADAEHLQKRLCWKDAEIKALKDEVNALRQKFNCPREHSGDREESETICD